MQKPEWVLGHHVSVCERERLKMIPRQRRSPCLYTHTRRREPHHLARCQSDGEGNKGSILCVRTVSAPIVFGERFDLFLLLLLFFFFFLFDEVTFLRVGPG